MENVGKITLKIFKEEKNIMELSELLSKWGQAKLSHKNIRRLDRPLDCEYEFERFGCNPSSYAYVKFECVPGNKFEYKSVAQWPKDVSINEINHLEQAVIEAMIDLLVSESNEPLIGCSITLSQVKCSLKGSSYDAFYSATQKAIAQLVKNSEWIEIYLD